MRQHEQMTLDEYAATVGRDNGMAAAEINAESVHSGWASKALIFLERFLNSYSFEFMAEDVRLYAESNGFIKPPSERAWGAVILKAARHGIIRKVGYRNTRNPKAHKTPAALWARA